MMIRELDRRTDRRAVESIDTAFETSSVFDEICAASIDTSAISARFS